MIGDEDKLTPSVPVAFPFEGYKAFLNRVTIPWFSNIILVIKAK